jgi:hypothetical protein
MLQFTIKARYGMVVVHEGKFAKSRLLYRGAGVEFYAIGVSGHLGNEVAANLAMNKCEELHIPIISLRRAN